MLYILYFVLFDKAVLKLQSERFLNYVIT